MAEAAQPTTNGSWRNRSRAQGHASQHHCLPPAPPGGLWVRAVDNLPVPVPVQIHHELLRRLSLCWFFLSLPFPSSCSSSKPQASRRRPHHLFPLFLLLPFRVLCHLFVLRFVYFTALGLCHSSSFRARTNPPLSGPQPVCACPCVTAHPPFAPQSRPTRPDNSACHSTARLSASIQTP